MKTKWLFNGLMVIIIYPLFLLYGYAEAQEIILNHEVPVMVKGEYEYFPVIETAYAVTPHILFTRDMRYGHFPNDGIIVGTDIPVWFYWLDFRMGVKAFLVEETMEVSANLPEWAEILIPAVEQSLETDGGWEKIIDKFSAKSHVKIPVQMH